MPASKQQHQLVLWRRGQVLELVAKGHNQAEISDILKVDRSVICRDITYLNMQAKENIRTFIDSRLPHEYEKCLVGIKQVLKIAWNTTNEPDIDRREKIQALSLVKECYTTTLDLLTNASILNDAMKFVAKHQNKQQQHKQNQNNKEEVTAASTEESEPTEKKEDKPITDNNDDETIKVRLEDTNQVF